MYNCGMRAAGDPYILNITEAVALLRSGGVIALPTDTVYGIAASLDHPTAIERLFEIKGRELTKAIPLLVSNSLTLDELAEAPDERVQRLVRWLWPGALTVVVRASSRVPNGIRRGLPTVGVRMPNHASMLEVIERAGGVLAVTSANVSGEREALSAAQVRERLGDLIDGVVDGGPSPGNQPSTVVDFTADCVRILREGALSSDAIFSILREAGQR